MKLFNTAAAKFIAVFPRASDFLFSILLIPCAFIFRSYRRVGSQYLKRSTQTLKKMGIFPIRDHYYDPLFNESHLKRPLSDDRNLPAINFNESGQLALLSRLTNADELSEMSLDRRSGSLAEFYIDNGSYERGDADFLYQFIRTVKPKKVLEIGSGNSTKIARMALKKNDSEKGGKSVHLCIEPYEMSFLEGLGFEVIRKKVEECPLELFQQLQAGDLLFIDSSHMIRPQGDVLYEYLEIIPQLNRGVLIHIHDIFSPKDYPHQWIVEEMRFWNEQYLFEALVSHSSRYKIIAALNYLKHNHFQSLKKVCPYLNEKAEPSSLYLEVMDSIH